MLIEPLVAHRSVVPFNVSILPRFARLDVCSLTPLFPARDVNGSLMYSGPLSQRIALGLPRHSITCSGARVTRSDDSEQSTATPKPARLKSSIRLKAHKVWPSESESCIKSIDPVPLMPLGATRLSGAFLINRFLGLMRRLSASFQ